MSKLLAERKDALHKIKTYIDAHPQEIKKLFDFNKTVHADLDLSWINTEFQEKEIGPKEEYQIVIATVQPNQTSQSHHHEVGASSLVVLGQKNGFSAPLKLFYKSGAFKPEGEIKYAEKIACTEGLEIDIPANTVHQFINENNEPAYLLIVTHPIISVEEGHEDIHFVS
jgi:quercetin dioxygenase-like cupin family protein